MPAVQLDRKQRHAIKRRAERVLDAIERPRMCEICTRLDYEAAKVGGLGVYHVWEPSWGGGQEPDNLRFYCRECYEWVRERRRVTNHPSASGLSGPSTAVPADHGLPQ